MNKIIIFGLGDLAEQMNFFLEQCSDVAGFTVDDEYVKESVFNGKDVVPFSQLAKTYPCDEYEICLTVGYSKMNKNRGEKAALLKSMGYKLTTYIHPTAVNSASEIGEGCLIMENSTIGAFARLGIANIVRPGSMISHHTAVGNFNYFAPCSCIAGSVTVGSNCFFGLNCTVKNRVTVADFTLVGAGAYISKDTEKFGVYAPARTVKLEKNSMDIM